jgi:hypothetical protein
VERTKAVEKKYNVFMNGVVMDRNVSHEEAEILVDEYIEADEELGEEDNYYMIKPVE